MDEIKVKKSWFGLGKAKSIELPTLPFSNGKKETRSMKPEDFMDMIARTEQRNIMRDGEDAQSEIENMLKFGQRTWKSKKQEAAGAVLKETIEEIQEERKPKPEAPKAEKVVVEKPKPKFEVFEFGKARTPEQQKEMEKIRKKVEADIERKQKARKELMELIKMQKSGKLLTARQIAHLKAFATEELREAA
jgi:hypothetical protein